MIAELEARDRLNAVPVEPEGRRRARIPARAAYAAANGPGGRGGAGGRTGRGSPRQRLAQIGPYIATVLPDGTGLGLFDLLSGSPLRILDRLDHSIVGVVGESTGRRLVTIERSSGGFDRAVRSCDGVGSGSAAPRSDLQVNLWDSDQLDRPIAKLAWRVEPMRRGESPPPLVAISPDGKTVAVAPFRGMSVKLYSGAGTAVRS